MSEELRALKAYLEERDARMEPRMDQRLAEMEARMDQRLAEMEARMGQQMETRMDQRFAQSEARIDARFDKLEAENHHTRVLVEGLYDNSRLLAEAILGTGERIDALREETLGRLDEIKASVDMVHQAWVPRVQRLETRVKTLEDKAEREHRDVLDVVRERFGRQA